MQRNWTLSSALVWALCLIETCPTLPIVRPFPTCSPIYCLPASCSEFLLMPQPGSACSLCTCSWLSVILEKPRVPGRKGPCHLHPIEVCFLGELFLLSVLNSVRESTTKSVVVYLY